MKHLDFTQIEQRLAFLWKQYIWAGELLDIVAPFLN